MHKDGSGAPPRQNDLLPELVAAMSDTKKVREDVKRGGRAERRAGEAGRDLPKIKIANMVYTWHLRSM